LIGLLIALYPAHWRRRYGEEFRAVLEMRPLGPFDVADVVLGALDARLTRSRRGEATGHDGGHNVMLRIGGFGAIVGGVLWFSGMAALSADDTAPALWGAVAILGNLALLVALAGLSAFQAHRHPRLAWAAFAIPAFGTIASVVGLAGMLIPMGIFAGGSTIDPWSIWFIGLLATLVGSVLFAIATVRARVLSRRAAISLGGFAAISIAIGLGLAGPSGDGSSDELATAVAIGAFAASWVALGVSALRRGPIRAIAPA
jgi:hypothetical protein